MDILPTIALSVISYFACQFLFPNCRFRIRPLISPLNWFLCLFFMQMVLVPLVVAAVGPSGAFLPFMPSDTAINVALLMNTLAFVSFCGAVQAFHRRQAGFGMERSAMSPRGWFPPLWMIILFAAVGIVGIFLRFGSLRHLVEYFTDPVSYLIDATAKSEDSAALAGGLTVLLSYFLPFSMIMLWCRGFYRKQMRRSILARAVSPILVVLVALSSALLGYSRSSFVIPMIGIAAVMVKRSTSASIVKFVSLGALVLVLLLIVSSYRLLFTSQGSVVNQTFDVSFFSDMFQDYGTAPQYLGFLLQRTDYAQNPGLGRVLLSSALSPVPILGKPFRDNSGNSVYNDLLGRGDQPATFVGELFLDFSVFGVIAGFLALGALVAILQNSFELSGEPFKVYVLQFVSICLSYFVVCGLEEVSQHAIYLLWPVYCFVLYRWVNERRSSRCDNRREFEMLRLTRAE